jgi:hypothetical protein
LSGGGRDVYVLEPDSAVLVEGRAAHALYPDVLACIVDAVR